MAKELGCDVVVFVRDRDSDEDREQEIADAMATAPTEIADAPTIVGGVAVRRVESWMLALHGERDSEQMSNAKVDERLAARAVEPNSTQALVDAVKRADLVDIPADAVSLTRWLDLVDRAFGSVPSGDEDSRDI